MPQIGGVFIPDDLVPTVSAVEQARPSLGAIFTGAAEQAYGQVRYGLPYALSKVTGGLTAQDDTFYRAGLESTSRAAAAAGPASLADLTSGRTGFGRFVAENLTASLPQMAGTLAGAVGGGLAAGPGGAVAGAIAAGTPMFVGSNVDRAVQEQGGLSTAGAERALLTAPFQSSADTLIGRFLPGAGKIAGGLASTQTGNFLARTAKSIAKAGATEAVTEAGQQLGERYAAGIDVGGPEAASEYVNAAVTAFAVGGVLGAGGGLRRTAAHNKPAADVSMDDLNEAIESGLSGEKRPPAAPPALSPPNPAGTLALPSPDAFPRGPDLYTDTRGVTAPTMRPYGQPDLVTDARGRTYAGLPEGVTPNDPRLPRPGEPTLADVQAILDARRPQIPDALAAPAPAATAQRLEQVSRQALATAQGAGMPAPTIGDAPVRMFAAEPIADLQAAANAKNASEQVKAAAQQEITQRYAEVSGQAPLADGEFQARLDDLKQGLRGQFAQKLTATNPTELLDKVYTQIFDNADTASNVTKLAQRVGLLDADLNPTELASQIETQRTAATVAERTPTTPVGTPVGVAPAVPAAPVAPAAPAASSAAIPPLPPEAVSLAPQQVDPEFAPQWNQLKSAAGITRMRGAAVLSETPPNMDVARAQVFDALANDQLTRSGEASQVERMAQKMGLITDDESMDVTPLGRQTYLSTPAAQPEIETARTLQGFTGAQGTAFDQGVQAVATGREVANTSFESMAAYEAGKVWAQDVVNTAGPKSLAQTRAIQDRQASRTTGRAVARDQIQRTELTPGQVQQRSLNRLLDAADLRAASDSDVAVLRRMVRDGATPQEVGEALQQVQGGKTLFRQPPSVAPVLPGLPTRGQPVFKELVQPADRRATSAQSEAAVRAYSLRNLIAFAQSEGGITDARAKKLHDMLDQGKVDQVSNNLKAFNDDGLAARSRDFFNNGGFLGMADQKFEQAIDGKSFDEVLEHMVKNAPSTYHREILSRVSALAKQITKAGGHEFAIQIVRPGDAVPTALANPDVRAYTQITGVPAKATVYLKGVEMGPESGTNYQLAAHEMVHAVTMEALEFAQASDPDGKTLLGNAAKGLRDLSRDIVRHLHQRLDDPSAVMNHIPLELSAAMQEVNAFSNPHEILAWGLTNPQMQNYLNSIEYKPRRSVFTRLVELVRDLLGLKGVKHDTALAELLRVSEQVFGTSARELRPAFVRNDPNGLETRVLGAAASAAGQSAANRTVTAANDVTQTIVQTVSQAAENINLADLGVKARRVALGWFSQNHIDRLYGAAMPGLLARSDAKRQHDAVRGRFASMGDESYQRFEALQRANASHAEKLGRLMATTTEFKLDPDKAFDDHTHLEGDPNIPALKRLHAEAVKMKNDLSRGDGEGYKLYQEFRARNDTMNYARLANELHSLVALDPELSLGVEGAGVNPMDTFMSLGDLDTPAAIRSHWQTAVQDQLKAATAFVTRKRGETAAQGTESDIRAMDQHLSPIEAKIAATYEALAGMARSPYFHLGRFGDNFGSATIRKLENGTVDPRAQEHVALALADAGFRNIQISTDNTRPKFSARFDTVDQTNKFRDLMLELHKQGWLDGEVGDIHYGPRERADNFGVADGLPQYVQRYIQAIEQSPTFVPTDTMSPKERSALEARKQEALQLARDTWLEQQPDSAIAKVLTARYTVPGYDPDMIRNFAHRWNVGATNLASVATSAKIGNAYRDMRSQVVEARSAGNTDDPNLLSDLLTETHQRDATNPVNPTAGSFDKLRAISHAYYLGFSPAYGAIQLMSVGTNALPELAKRHGYAASFHAVRRASTQALALMRAATTEAAKGGAAHYADVALTETALQNARLSKPATDFMRRMIATGSIDIGQSANALSQIARNGTGSKLDVTLKYASAIGLHTETFARLVTALAAHELHGGTDVDAKAAYATNVVSNTMFDYQSWNTARQLGKQGFVGPLTPLVTQFMTYSAQMTEKLYSEAADAIGRPRPGESAAETAARAKGARTFLLGHMTAITALAGTLGLPFASAFAAAVEKMVSVVSDDDEPYDATASWRNFLADVLGKDVAEVVARGVPRALGFDISGRVGEADLIPFSALLGDKRGWREAVEASLGRATGAGPDMLLNLADAGSKFGDGDVMGGLVAALPVGFKGAAKAYQMTTDGYVDTKGQKLPMSPGTSDILFQLLGFSPAQKAEYSEARGDQQTRRVQLTRAAATLRGQILKAMTGGDLDQARELVTQAQAFDQENPAFAVIPSLAGALQRQQTTAARARALSTPVGVQLNDIAGQRLTRYADVNYQ